MSDELDADLYDDTITCETCAPCGCEIVDQGPDPRDSVVLHAPTCAEGRKA